MRFELVKRPDSGVPGMSVGRFAWCIVRSTHYLTCAIAETKRGHCAKRPGCDYSADPADSGQDP